MLLLGGAAASTTITPAEAARIILGRRETARNDLLAYTQFLKPEYKAGWVHQQISNVLMDALNKRPWVDTKGYEHPVTDRVIIDVPPRHGKSELASRKLPGFFLGRQPKKEIIAASYAAELATDFGRDVRNAIDSPAYRALFPEVALATDSQAKNKWHTQDGGVYLSTGVGGACTGMGAHVLLIDDPVKNRAEAESVTTREAIWNWYRSTAYTRLMPGGVVIIIMTRWHEDDMVGRLLNEEAESGQEEWRKLILPAISESGEALWPEAYPKDVLERTRRAIGEREWTALYEQRPRPIEGSFFNVNDMLVGGEPVAYPNICDGVFAVIDSATKTGNTNDGTAVTYFARSKNGIPLTVLDWDIVQIEGALLETWLPQVFAHLETLARSTGSRMGIAGVWIEDKASGMILLQQAKRRGMKVHAIDSKLTAVGKSERAINISGYVTRERIKFSDVAYNKTRTYKGVTKNHLLSQVLSFYVGTKDMGDDDLLDTFTYGASLALGNQQGY